MVAAVVVSVVAVLGLDTVTAPAAYASGSNWSGWSGSCFGWTIWNANQVTGYVWDHSSDRCYVNIYQSEDSPSGPGAYALPWGVTSGDQTGAHTPTYWHGPASNGHRLWDQVCVGDTTVAVNPACSPWYS